MLAASKQQLRYRGFKHPWHAPGIRLAHRQPQLQRFRLVVANTAGTQARKDSLLASANHPTSESSITMWR